MKTSKFFLKTTDELKMLFQTKRDLRERLVNKVSVYDVAIREIECELIKRGAKP